MTMRVGLDLTPLLAGDTGIARYAAELRAGLATRDDVVVHGYGIGRGSAPAVPMRRLPMPMRVIHAAWRAGIPLGVGPLTGRVDLMHCTDLVPPPTRRPVVLTIHDVLAVQVPEYFSERTISIVQSQLRALYRVSAVITTCAATADAITEVTGFDRELIAVVPLGRRVPDVVPESSPVAEPYVLAVGAVNRRKAFDVAVKALHRLGPGAPLLVIAGPTGPDSAETIDAIEALGMRDRVRVLGRVDDTELNALYAHALALLHTSVAEGFGIPAIEALGFGTPLIAADIPPIRELTAPAARLVPVRDVDATAAALRSVWDDPEETARLVEAGRACTRDLTWMRTVEETVEVYRDVLSR